MFERCRITAFFCSVMLVFFACHYWYAGQYGLALAMLGFVAFAWTKQTWKQYSVLGVLYFAVWEWLSTAFGIMQFRPALGGEWGRAVFIVVMTAFLTLCSASLLLGVLLKRETQDSACSPPAETAGSAEYREKLKAVLFLLCFLLVQGISRHAPLNILLSERFFPLFGPVQAFMLAWYGVWIFEKLSGRKTHNKYRPRIWLIFSFVFFVQLFLGLLGFEKFLMSGKLHFPVPAFIWFGALYKGAFGFMAGLVLFAVLLTGSAWCSHLCYFGSLDNAAAKTGKLSALPEKWRKIACIGRYAVFFLGGLSAVLLSYYGCSLVLVLFFSWVYTGMSAAVLGLLSRKYGAMMHCSAFCPMGAVVNCLAKFSPWRLRVGSSCDGCRACEKVCRYRAISAESRARGKVHFHCSLCLDCMNACRQNALFLQIAGTKLSAESAKTIFLFFLAVIHILFLSFARV